jgi:adenylate kinase
VRHYLSHGALVPDEIVLSMVRQEFVAAKAAGVGYVLDGCPRTCAQATALARMATGLGMAAEVAGHAVRPRTAGWTF